MIKLTRKKNNTVVYINPSAISAVGTNDNETCVFVVGDPIPFTVKETVEEVMRQIEEQRR